VRRDHLGGADCLTLGYEAGVLSCAADCTLDTSSCTSCGNGIAGPGEDCDAVDLGSQTCATLGFMGGTLACTAVCTFDTSSCT
jgi:hypothetical protein